MINIVMNFTPGKLASAVSDPDGECFFGHLFAGFALPEVLPTSGKPSRMDVKASDFMVFRKQFSSSVACRARTAGNQDDFLLHKRR